MAEARRKGERPIRGRIIGRDGDTFLLESWRNGGTYHVVNPLYTYGEVAAELGLHVGTVRRAVRDGDMPCRRFGRSVRFTRDDIDEYIDRSKCTAAPTAPPKQASGLLGPLVAKSNQRQSVSARCRE